MGMRILLRRETVLKLIVVMVAQPCEYSKNCWIVHLKWVMNYIIKLYLKNQQEKQGNQTTLSLLQPSLLQFCPWPACSADTLPLCQQPTILGKVVRFRSNPYRS